MATIQTSRVIPIAAQYKFKGVLEAAYLIRLLLQQKSNNEIRRALAQTFGDHWGKANQERRYYNLLQGYVRHHYEADYHRYLLKENIRFKPRDQKILRNTLVRYLISEHGLHGGSEIVNDLG
jgi:hypothetical protein